MPEELELALTKNGCRISERGCCIMNQESCHVRYTSAAIVFIVLLVSAAGGDLRDKGTDADFPELRGAAIGP